jgi:hypothetical protein
MNSKPALRKATLRYTDYRGVQHSVRVSAKLARELATFQRWAKRRDALFRRHHILATDLKAKGTHRSNGDADVLELEGYLNFEMETASIRYNGRATANAWQGPRFRFSLLLGETPTWSGPASLWVTNDQGELVCRFCGHLAKLPIYACCLNPDCCRTGRDADLAWMS